MLSHSGEGDQLAAALGSFGYSGVFRHFVGFDGTGPVNAMKACRLLCGLFRLPILVCLPRGCVRLHSWNGPRAQKCVEILLCQMCCLESLLLRDPFFLAVLSVGIILPTENSQGRCNGVRLSEWGLRIIRGTFRKSSPACVMDLVWRLQWWIEEAIATEPAVFPLGGCALLVLHLRNVHIHRRGVGMHGFFFFFSTCATTASVVAPQCRKQRLQ